MIWYTAFDASGRSGRAVLTDVVAERGGGVLKGCRGGGEVLVSLHRLGVIVVA